MTPALVYFLPVDISDALPVSTLSKPPTIQIIKGIFIGGLAIWMTRLRRGLAVARCVKIFVYEEFSNVCAVKEC